MQYFSAIIGIGWVVSSLLTGEGTHLALASVWLVSAIIQHIEISVRSKKKQDTKKYQE